MTAHAMSTDAASIADRAAALCTEWEDPELALEAASSELQSDDAPVLAAWILSERLDRAADAIARLDALDEQANLSDSVAADAVRVRVLAARRLGDDDLLVPALLDELDLYDDVDERAPRLLELADLMRTQAAGPEGALLLLEQAVREAPGRSDARDAWLEHAPPEKAAEVLRDTLSELEDDAARAALHAALFDLYAGPLDDAVLAEAQALLAWEHDPDIERVHPAVLAALDASGDAEAARELARRRFDASPGDPALRDDLLARLEEDDHAARLEVMREARDAGDVSPEDRIAEALLVLALEDDAEAAQRLLVEAHESTEDAEAAEHALDVLDDTLSDDDRAAWLLRVAERAAAPRNHEAAWAAAALLEQLGEPGPAAAAVQAYRAEVNDDERLSLLVRIEDALPGSRASFELLQRWTDAAPDDPTRAARYVEIADRRSAEGDDPTEALEAAIATDPARHDITIRLAERYLRAEDWAAAEVVLTRVTRLGEAVATGDDLARLWAHLASTRSRLGQPAGATLAWCGVLDHAGDAPLRRRAVEAIVRDAFVRDDLGHAARALAEADRLADTSDASLAHAVGELLQREGRGDEAQTWHRRALELQPTHTQALRALTHDDDTRDVETLLALAKATDDPTERFATLLKLADAYDDRGDVDDAVATLEFAAELEPEAREPLHRMLAMHKAAEAWDLACDVLLRLTRLETDPKRAARFLVAIAVLERDELARPARAVRAYAQALDIQPTDEALWEQLTGLLRDMQWWAELDAAIEAQQARLQRADAPASRRAALEVERGDLLADALGRPDDAIAAWQRALVLRPNDIDVLERIARTYPAEGKDDAQLIREHRAVLAVAADRPASHYLLHMAYKRERAFDRAWLHAAALRVLGDDDARAEAFYTEHRPSQVRLTRRGLTDVEWRRLEAGVLGEAGFTYLRALSLWSRRLVARTPRDWGLHARRDRHTSETLGEAAGLFAYLPGALGVSLDAIYGSSMHAGVHVAGFEQSALVVGADVLATSVDRRLVFRIARATALLHPSLALAATVGHPQSLHALVGGCFALAGLAEEGLPAEASAWRDALADEHAEVVRKLIEATRTYAQAGGTARDAQRWPHAAEIVAGRAALLLTGDLLRAVEATQAATTTLSAAPIGDRLLDLLAFWSSDDHAHLRAELGLGIGQ